MPEKRIVKLFDTTLRDGEQTPGVNLNSQDKIEIAHSLEALGIDVVEAGFASSSPGDFKAVESVAEALKYTTVASLARSNESDIDASAAALAKAANPRIHVFIATSPVHMEYKFKLSPEAVCERAVKAVAYARNKCAEVEFSPEDATRSDVEFLYKVIEGVIDAGASIINIPDTVGYTTPTEFYRLITNIKNNVKNINRAVLSVHCHNDLGLAVSNSLAAVEAGAEQIEGTINGIGERGGNAALEEIIMALHTRSEYFVAKTNAVTTQIIQTSRTISSLTGIIMQPNKPIVGVNAFLHSSGIHQHGILANKATYEIMTPESVGLVTGSGLTLGKLSGRHAFAEKLRDLGYNLETHALNAAFELFKRTADQKKNITDSDISAIAIEFVGVGEGKYELDTFQIQSGNSQKSMAMINLKMKGEAAPSLLTEAAVGSGPIDAAFNAINRITKTEAILESYNIRAATEGADALGIADVKLLSNGEMFRGTGTSTDIIEASIKAYLNALNKLV